MPNVIRSFETRPSQQVNKTSVKRGHSLQALRMMPEMIGTHRNGLFRANRSQCSSYQAFLVPDMSQIKGLELLVVAAGLSRMKELIESNVHSKLPWASKSEISNSA